jgi:DNA repair protein RecO (recombination protein O)
VTEARDVGFVLRTWPLREADLIVSAYVREHGKIRAVAHGAKRPRSRWAGALDPLTEVELCWREREGQELVSLRDGDIVRSPYHPMPSLEATWALAFIAELVDETAPPHDADETLYRLVRACIDAILAGGHAGTVARYAHAWVLRLHGVLPDVQACASCGANLARSGGSWRSRVHGLACRRCAGAEDQGGPTLFAEDIAALAEMARKPPGDVSAPSDKALRRIGVFLHQVLVEHLGKQLKSERFLDELEPR